MKIRYAVCVDNSEYPPSLEIHEIYRVVPDDADREGDLRVIDESGEDYLYPGRHLVMVDLLQETERTLADSFDRPRGTGGRRLRLATGA
jgi:hypothetical protein